MFKSLVICVITRGNWVKPSIKRLFVKKYIRIVVVDRRHFGFDYMPTILGFEVTQVSCKEKRNIQQIKSRN